MRARLWDRTSRSTEGDSVAVEAYERGGYGGPQAPTGGTWVRHVRGRQEVGEQSGEVVEGTSSGPEGA